MNLVAISFILKSLSFPTPSTDACVLSFLKKFMAEQAFSKWHFRIKLWPNWC